MKFDDSVLSYSERLSYALRSLYSRSGYQPYRMSKFEEYDLYSRNKDFLISDQVITFTDTTGRLMALKPDVTLSIIKNHPDDETHKLFYHENVYRVSKGTGSYKEIPQCGVECIGRVNDAVIGECLLLAAQSLNEISPDFVLDVGSLDLLSFFVNRLTDNKKIREALIACASQKNNDGIYDLAEVYDLPSKSAAVLLELLDTCGPAAEVMEELQSLCRLFGCSKFGRKLQKALAPLLDSEYAGRVRIDFSVVNDMNYYNGVVFKGFVNGVPDSVLSGGQYDNLMKRMKRKSKAIGFGVYLDMLERAEDLTDGASRGDGMLNIALPKGRLGEDVYAKFAAAGYSCPGMDENNRKLIFENPEAGVRFFWVKPSDVAIYVERGAADIGIAGRDILLENRPEIYELADLNIGKCRMAVAAPEGFRDDTRRTLRVATKFSRIAADHYARKGRDIDIIHLNGSIEIAPILGLTDVIVDIVETGTTLKENHLEVIEEIVPITARLIANKTSVKFKGEQIKTLIQEIQND